MKNLYIKDDNGSYVPVQLELIAPDDLANKLIIITVGNEEYNLSEETMHYIRESFIKSEIIIDAMRRSLAADLLIIPHIINMELLSKVELETKAVCIQIDKNDEIDDLPEIKQQITDKIGKKPVVIPSPITLKEYKEIKVILERIKIRKQRHGGALTK